VDLNASSVAAASAFHIIGIDHKIVRFCLPEATRSNREWIFGAKPAEPFSWATPLETKPVREFIPKNNSKYTDMHWQDFRKSPVKILV
jgi:hypothetical protein